VRSRRWRSLLVAKFFASRCGGTRAPPQSASGWRKLVQFPGSRSQFQAVVRPLTGSVFGGSFRGEFFRPLRGLAPVNAMHSPGLRRGATVFRPLRGLRRADSNRIGRDEMLPHLAGLKSRGPSIVLTGLVFGPPVPGVKTPGFHRGIPLGCRGTRWRPEFARGSGA
jgi:hypothetical protein